MKKVLIAAPCAGYKEYSLNDYFECIATQSYTNCDSILCVNGDTNEDTEKIKQLYEQFEYVNIAGETKKPIVLSLPNSHLVSRNVRIGFAREKMRRYAIDNGYDALLFLDTDTIPLDKDFITRLLSWDVPAVTGLYHYKKTNQAVIVSKESGTNLTAKECEDAYNSNRLLPILACGYGCILFQREALNIPFDMKAWGKDIGEDLGHSRELYRKQIPLLFDARVICKHLGEPNYAQTLKRDMQLPLIIENESQQRKV